jgi:hypothetical protein
MRPRTTTLFTRAPAKCGLCHITGRKIAIRVRQINSNRMTAANAAMAMPSTSQLLTLGRMGMTSVFVFIFLRLAGGLLPKIAAQRNQSCQCMFYLRAG